jgi:hypothetical protein
MISWTPSSIVVATWGLRCPNHSLVESWARESITIHITDNEIQPRNCKSFKAYLIRDIFGGPSSPRATHPDWFVSTVCRHVSRDAKYTLSPGSRPTLWTFVFSEPGSLHACASQREDTATSTQPLTPTSARVGDNAARLAHRHLLQIEALQRPPHPTAVPPCSVGERNAGGFGVSPTAGLAGALVGEEEGFAVVGGIESHRGHRRPHQPCLLASVLSEVRVRAAAPASGVRDGARDRRRPRRRSHSVPVLRAVRSLVPRRRLETPCPAVRRRARFRHLRLPRGDHGQRLASVRWNAAKRNKRVTSPHFWCRVILSICATNQTQSQ